MHPEPSSILKVHLLLLWAAIALVPTCVNLHAQSNAPSGFEVASLRLSPPGDARFTNVSPVGSGRFVVTNARLPFLLEMAYNVDANQLSHLPSWSDSAMYDIAAKTEGEAPLPYEKLRPLLQQLLTERLHLAVHHETKLVKGYALVAAKAGLKLTASKGGSGQPQIIPNEIRGNNISLNTLAAMLSRPAQRPVVNKTGINDNFDVVLKYASMEAPDSSLPSVFTALQEQLGLKLENQEVILDIVVVDHVDKVPTDN